MVGGVHLRCIFGHHDVGGGGIAEGTFLNLFGAIVISMILGDESLKLKSKLDLISSYYA
jgi:hypothetical protein